MRKEMSPVERVLWNRIRANQLDGLHFRRQQIVAGYIADFYCHTAGIAMEVDGDTHDDPAKDAFRDSIFEGKGIRVLRFTNAQVLHETDAVLEAILSVAREAKRTAP
jgi:very-short-patch-repair endonuclease